MEHESDGADECQPTTSNTNVRNKVSSWVSNFVSEMRSKSPAVVQRLVDSLPNENVTEIPGDILNETDKRYDSIEQLKASEELCEDINCVSTTPNLIESNVVDIVNVHTEDDDDEDGNEQFGGCYSSGQNDADDEENGESSEIDEKQPLNPKSRVSKQDDEGGGGGSSGEGGGDSGNSRTQPNPNPNSDRRFWQKGASVLTALRIRSNNTDSKRNTVTEDLNASLAVSSHSDEPDTNTNSTAPQTNSILNKTKLNEFYCKLSINKKRYNFIKDRKMDAKKLLSNAKSRFLANWDESQAISVDDHNNQQATTDDDDVDERCDNNLNDSMPVIEPNPETETAQATDAITTTAAAAPASTTTTTAAAIATTIVSEPEMCGAASMAACDTSDMDLSADDFSRLSHSNDMLSEDNEDSFNISMPSIDSHHTAQQLHHHHHHLNVSRRIAMADIGRSTSDNPRLRNKFYLADIGRSFSEHQDDEAILIGERNISAPSSSIAIQNNNRSNGNFFERRAYSVSPTQRGLKRGVLSREQSLSDSSRHRNQLSKGSSFQSDSSHCSSVESLLDARKPDSEAILRQLGFGPAHQEDLLSRIPKRFLKPSQVPGIDTEAFMRQQQIASNLHEQSILGYRGLTGNPHVLPSVIVAKIMERFQLSDEKNSKLYDMFNDGRPMSAPPTPGPTDLADLRHHPEP